jgi:hypothetical protein
MTLATYSPNTHIERINARRRAIAEMNEVDRFILRGKICVKGREWLESNGFTSMQSAWRACHNAGWLIIALKRVTITEARTYADVALALVAQKTIASLSVLDTVKDPSMKGMVNSALDFLAYRMNFQDFMAHAQRHGLPESDQPEIAACNEAVRAALYAAVISGRANDGRVDGGRDWRGGRLDWETAHAADCALTVSDYAARALASNIYPHDYKRMRKGQADIIRRLLPDFPEFR